MKRKAPLEFPNIERDNGRMVMHGHIHGSIVVLDANPGLPDNTAVTVVAERVADKKNRTRVKLPIFACGEPGSVHLDNERIAEILDGEDVLSARH